MGLFRKEEIIKKPEEKKEDIYFTLIAIAPTYEHTVYNKLSALERVVELQLLFGEYDLIVKHTSPIDFNFINGIIGFKTLKCRQKNLPNINPEINL